MRWVYYRRRAVVGGSALLVLWLVTQAVVGVAGWLGGDDDGAEAATAGAPGAELASEVAPTPTTAAPACPAPGALLPDGDEEPPATLLEAIDIALANGSLTRRTFGVSIWVEGYGEVASENAAEPLIPASNQKILTAMGVLELLDHQQRLVTEIRATGPIDAAGVVQGDLLIVGGGDPLIKRQGPHSIEDLAGQLVDEVGITGVTGNIVGDESRYDQIRKAPGWLEWEMPLPGGSMSALMVNSNSRLGDKAYLENPTVHNAELLRNALEDLGVEVSGTPVAGTVPADAELVHDYPSPTIEEIVRIMMHESDNMTAEMLTKEVGLQVRGEGSSTAGRAAMIEALEERLCITIDGFDDDSSGISREDRRPAQTWRDMLLAARDAPWYDSLLESMPVAGAEDGTLAGRFLGTSAVGNVAAKTGTTGQAVALSGYATTEGDRDVVFSIIVNGDQPEPAVPAMDAIVLAVQADGS
jgi:D-alanyl-D-alanine carboxypeptidase/D-alanyl-D-alanine-endopeptidase (penicillin-binding protein 4)